MREGEDTSAGVSCGRFVRGKHAFLVEHARHASSTEEEVLAGPESSRNCHTAKMKIEIPLKTVLNREV